VEIEFVVRVVSRRSGRYARQLLCLGVDRPYATSGQFTLAVGPEPLLGDDLCVLDGSRNTGFQ